MTTLLWVQRGRPAGTPPDGHSWWRGSGRAGQLPGSWAKADLRDLLPKRPDEPAPPALLEAPMGTDVIGRELGRPAASSRQGGPRCPRLGRVIGLLGSQDLPGAEAAAGLAGVETSLIREQSSP